MIKDVCKSRGHLCWLAATLVALTAPGFTAENAEDRPLELDPLRVVGTRDQVEQLPGSASFLDQEDIRIQGYDNVDQLIRRVPGAYFRTEDGYGLFPNISLRGVGSMRTSKLTVMEDGILSAPAPYSNPSAYYSPTTGRMSGFEVLKGSSQVRYGPHTTGGVLNYLSTPIPQTSQGYVRTLYGENNEARVHAHYGTTQAYEWGNVGILAENFYRTTEGFKTIDGAPDFEHRDRTGFTKVEPMVKLAFEPDTTQRQRVELKLGYTDMNADETYLGLTDSDFRANPYRRYSSTRFDHIDTQHVRSSLSHMIEPAPDLRITTTGYFNRFERAWYKLHNVSTDRADDADQADNTMNLSQALAESDEDEHLGVLRGQREGTLRYRNNARDYDSYGVQQTHNLEFFGPTLDHNIELGFRLHHDFENRFQEETNYLQNDEGAIDGRFRQEPGAQDNRRSETDAFAVYLQDRITFGPWSVTPGLRYEHLRFKVTDRRGAQTERERSHLDVYAPGLGITYHYDDQLSFFGGVHRGFSTPSPGDAIADLREERSTGYELGSRFDTRTGFQTEATLFWTDFSNLIVPDNIGGAGTGETENAGDVRSAGLELSVGYDPGIANDWAFRNPSFLSFTYTDARIRSDVSADGASGGAVESIFAGGEKGNRLPYVPEYQISAGTGLEIERWGAYLDAFYVPSTFASANNSSEQVNPNTGDPDARFGESDGYFLLDASIHYRLTEAAKVTAGVQNLLNEKYMASRLPHGPRPGHPRFAGVSLEVNF